MPDRDGPPRPAGWERALGVAVGGVVAGVVAVVLCVVLADRVLTLLVLAAVGLAVAAVVRMVRSMRRVGALDEARWVALVRVLLALLGVGVAVRGTVGLEREGLTLASVDDVMWSAGPWPPGVATRLHLMSELGRPAWEVVLSALGGVVLAWLLIGGGFRGLRSWAAADRAAAAGTTSPPFATQRAERLLATVLLVALTWLVVRGNVADVIGWWSSSGPGMSP
ncbi:MAG: hypothetical protein ABW025_04885 [Cellulomonas sp.]